MRVKEGRREGTRGDGEEGRGGKGEEEEGRRRGGGGEGEVRGRKGLEHKTCQGNFRVCSDDSSLLSVGIVNAIV